METPPRRQDERSRGMRSRGVHRVDTMDCMNNSQRDIGKLERVPLREVWPREAADFTPWLRDNIDVLSDQLGLSLTNAESEQSAGDFSVDLIAETEDGRSVVIENQLERSDHDHLGKLLTYAASYEAAIAIWIVAEARAEHVKAIAWLNQSAPSDVYLVRVEAIRIAGSPAAPLLTRIIGPSIEARQVADTKKDYSERHELRRAFWSGLLTLAKSRSRLHANISPGPYSAMYTHEGPLSWNYAIRQHAARVDLYIDAGADSEEANEALFKGLLAHRQEIEAAYGGPLDWERMDGSRACRVSQELAVGGYRDPEMEWPPIQEAMVDCMLRLEQASRPFLRTLLETSGSS
jgi:hypothetical protein